MFRGYYIHICPHYYLYVYEYIDFSHGIINTEYDETITGIKHHRVLSKLESVVIKTNKDQWSPLRQVLIFYVK